MVNNMSEHTATITLSVNHQKVCETVAIRMHLVDFLRENLGLTGSHLGCEHGVCGACQVRVNGHVVRGCLTLAVQTNGASVETVEGLTESGELRELQTAFLAHNAFQCGFCSAGMLLTALEIVQQYPSASREEIRELISGNYCRCTGYQSIVDAVESVLQKRKASAGALLPHALNQEPSIQGGAQ